MLEVAKSRTQIDYWSDIAQNKPVDWDKVFEGFQSTTDFPACIYYQELADHYPNAKVVLSVRDEDSWYRSVEQTILPFAKAAPRWIIALVPPLKRMHNAVDQLVWKNVFGGKASDPEHAKAVFRAHNQQVIERIPEERLLVFQAKDGWQPLCAFLGVKVPDEPFPHVNDTAEMQQRMRVMRILNWLPLALALIVILVWIAG